MFRGEEVAATDTDQRRHVEEGSPEKGPTECCSLSRLGARGDPGRLSETLPPDIYMKNIDFTLKFYEETHNKCQCLAASVNYSAFSVRKL